MGDFIIRKDMTMHGTLAQAVPTCAEQEALICGDVRVNWTQLGERVDALAPRPAMIVATLVEWTARLRSKEPV